MCLQEVITFRGRLEEHELPEFFAGIDALLLPYLRPSSCSASGPLHLALTYSCPVICSRSPYFDEAVSRTDIGYVATAGSVPEWADVLRRISSGSALRQLEEPIAAMRASLSWARIADGYSEILRGG
jgi:glycosyltransferase involved in cell wall biosynthesis